MNPRSQSGQMLIGALAGLLSGALVVGAALTLWSLSHRRWLSLHAEARAADAVAAALDLIVAATREADQVVPAPGGITLVRTLNPALPAALRKTCAGHRADARLTRCTIRIDQHQLIVDDHSGAAPQTLLGPRYATPVVDGRWRLLAANGSGWVEPPVLTDWSAVVGVELQLRTSATTRWQLRAALRRRTAPARGTPLCLPAQRGGALPLALLVVAALLLCARALFTVDSEQAAAARSGATRLQAFADAEHQLRQAERAVRGEPGSHDLTAGDQRPLVGLTETLVCTADPAGAVVCERRYWQLGPPGASD